MPAARYTLGTAVSSARPHTVSCTRRAWALSVNVARGIGSTRTTSRVASTINTALIKNR